VVEILETHTALALVAFRHAYREIRLVVHKLIGLLFACI
jgi:hypothetical protein